MKYKPGDKIYYYAKRRRAKVSLGEVNNVRTSANGRVMAYHVGDFWVTVKARDVIGPKVDLREPEYSFQADSCGV